MQLPTEQFGKNSRMQYKKENAYISTKKIEIKQHKTFFMKNFQSCRESGIVNKFRKLYSKISQIISNFLIGRLVESSHGRTKKKKIGTIISKMKSFLRCLKSLLPVIVLIYDCPNVSFLFSWFFLPPSGRFQIFSHKRTIHSRLIVTRCMVLRIKKHRPSLVFFFPSFSVNIVSHCYT